MLDAYEDMEEDAGLLIPHPQNEPVIGVIDTQFNEKVYFHEWVEYKNLLDPNIPLSRKDYEHGTAVSYIIVDGPQGNPELADGCGRFRVRHFGVATNNGFSSFTVLKMIRNIVASNRDIKVWNLSLGSKLEIKPNFISPEAAELDRIQSEYDVIFVVAGTNIPAGVTKKNMRIGSPADSLNSMVVNAVDFAGNSASYTRIGPVLSFFHKPDVSYYGGDGTVYTDKMVVCKDDMGAAYVAGTSFAAPWISRKLAYLIHIMGLSREVAKALLIDAASGWNRRDDISHRIGYGVVPKHINEVLKTPDDEIRFIMTGASEEYETYTYNLPVPVVDHAHPFYARATLAYFPQCDRKQGVRKCQSQGRWQGSISSHFRQSFQFFSVQTWQAPICSGRTAARRKNNFILHMAGCALPCAGSPPAGYRLCPHNRKCAGQSWPAAGRRQTPVWVPTCGGTACVPPPVRRT